MTDLAEDLDEALEQVITAARAHLAAVRAADGAIDDEAVWRSYVILNNTSFAYDQMLLDRYGEVTPWETDAIDLKTATDGGRAPFLTSGTAGQQSPPDPYPAVVSVRQRRDYRVPSLAALLAAAGEAAQRMALDEPVDPPATVGDAVLELVRDGDGSLAGLDLPELEPLAGVVMVTEVTEPLDLDEDDTAGLFQVRSAEPVLGRLDEEPVTDEDDDSAGSPDDDEPDSPPLR